MTLCFIAPLLLPSSPSSPKPGALLAAWFVFSCPAVSQPEPLAPDPAQRHHGPVPDHLLLMTYWVTTSCLDCRTGRPRTAQTPSRAPSQPPSQNPDNTSTAAFPAPTPLPLLTTSPVPDPMDPAPTPFVAQPPLVLPATTPVLDPTLSAPPAPSAGASPNFVTCSDFSASIGDLRQFLQDKIVSAVQAVTSALLTSQPAPTLQTPYTDNPAGPSSCPTPTSPTHTHRIYDLPKLANPSWPGSTALEEPAPVLIKGFSVVKGPTTSTSNCQFIKAVPNFLTFGRFWVVYLLLRSSTSNDRDLPVSLGRFYQHVANLAEVFPWDKVAGYVIAVCASRLGKATAADWARFNTELHATHFQGVQARLPPSSAGNKKPALRHDNPRCEQVCMSWNQGKCSGTGQRPCVRKHSIALPREAKVALQPQPHTAAHPSSSVLPHPSLELRLPDVAQQLLQAASGYWTKALLNYPDRPFVNQLLGAIDHGVHLGYSGPLRSHSRFRRIKNLPMDDRGNTHIRSEVTLRVQEGRLLEVDPQQLGLLPSVNDGIATHFTTIRYASLTTVLEFVWDNQGSRLWKSNLTDAFRHVVTTLDDACLLGFTFDGRFYMETGLTFGGRSSPWLFNLFAEALHWILQSMTHHPVDHYLDDFFGAVPAAGNPGQPLHALALACSALGLQLAPQKTFWNHTKLEILGIEVDTVRQCVGITIERRSRILDTIDNLLARCSARLIDWQHIAGCKRSRA
ncbi:uncharacterized protein UHOD_11259 [Ustilago sp. UG-2017b]|nr:uncharacterized protein UHOD_11259 [Ustilago sp. UG-2017b]